MAEELGTWPPEQAMVLLEVLQNAGLSPATKRARDGILVTVPDEHADEAHRQLVANMDAIARAARPPGATRPGARRPRPVKGADGTDRREERLPSERMLGIARPLVIVLVGLLILGTIGRHQPLLAIATVGVLIYVLGKRAQRRGDGPGDHRHR